MATDKKKAKAPKKPASVNHEEFTDLEERVDSLERQEINAVQRTVNPPLSSAQQMTKDVELLNERIESGLKEINNLRDLLHDTQMRVAANRLQAADIKSRLASELTAKSIIA